MARAQTGSALRDRLARGEEEAFVEVEIALRAARGKQEMTSNIMGVSVATICRALRDYPRLRAARDAAAGRERPLDDLLLEVPPGEHRLALVVRNQGDGVSALRQALAAILG